MTESQVDAITHNWTSMMDTWSGDRSWVGETFDTAYSYPPTSLIKRPGHNARVLPESHAERARLYIASIVVRYPLQLQVLFGLPMWLRFCDVWNDTGDFRLAMRAI